MKGPCHFPHGACRAVLLSPWVPKGSGLGDVIKNRNDDNGGDEMVMMGMTEADTGDMRTPGGCSESR